MVHRIHDAGLSPLAQVVSVGGGRRSVERGGEARVDDAFAVRLSSRRHQHVGSHHRSQADRVLAQFGGVGIAEKKFGGKNVGFRSSHNAPDC